MKNERQKRFWLSLKKNVKITVVVILTLLVISMMIDMYFEWNYLKYERANYLTINELKPKTAAIVLGAAVYGTRPSAILIDRLKSALKLYQAKKVRKIILSGDNGKKYYNELTPMLQFMLKNKVKQDDIFMDYEGFRTYDSFQRAKVLFGLKDVIVVTQQFHQPRAAFIAENLGIQVACLEADLRTYKNVSKYRIREYFARNLAWLDIFFTESLREREPKFPIEKSGKPTWKERDLGIEELNSRILEGEEP